MTEALQNAGADTEVEIRIACKKELQIYLGMQRIPVRTSNREFLDPLLWWKAMSECD